MKKAIVALALLVGLGGLVGCTSDAEVASHNISSEADDFKVLRHIVGVNAFSGEYLLEIVGFCNIHVDREDRQLEVTCKVGDGFKKHYLGMSENSPYTVEQLESSNVSTSHYRFVYKPSALIPNPEMR